MDKDDIVLACKPGSLIQESEVTELGLKVDEATSSLNKVNSSLDVLDSSLDAFSQAKSVYDIKAERTKDKMHKVLRQL